jgi:hypothetical protein
VQDRLPSGVGEETGRGRKESGDMKSGSIRLQNEEVRKHELLGVELVCVGQGVFAEVQRPRFPAVRKHYTYAERERRAEAEGIKYDEDARKLRDPGRALSGSVYVGGEHRRVGQLPAEGVDILDRKRKGELREKKRRKKAEDAERLDRGEGLVKGKRVKNRNNLTVAMKKAAVRGT